MRPAKHLALEHFQAVDVPFQGSQYTSLAFGGLCEQAGVRPSMGSVGDCFDNAMCESFFATLECELLERYRFKTQAEAGMAVFDFIEGWYNPRRRHSALGYLSPIEYERVHQDQTEQNMRSATVNHHPKITPGYQLKFPPPCVLFE